jgi:hypothetical protein
MIRVWSKDGKLLIQIEGHGDLVTSLCWSKDGTCIFSGSGDRTIRKWRLIDGEEVLMLQGHTNSVTSLCLFPDESHIVSASRDCSIRIWDLKANQQVGGPLLHGDEISLAMSPDGRYIASAGVDAKIYVWSLEVIVALGGDQVGVRVRCCCLVFSNRVLGLVQRVRNVKADAMLKVSHPYFSFIPRFTSLPGTHSSVNKRALTNCEIPGSSLIHLVSISRQKKERQDMSV